MAKEWSKQVAGNNRRKFSFVGGEGIVPIFTFQVASEAKRQRDLAEEHTQARSRIQGFNHSFNPLFLSG